MQIQQEYIICTSKLLALAPNLCRLLVFKHAAPHCTANPILHIAEGEHPHFTALAMMQESPMLRITGVLDEQNAPIFGDELDSLDLIEVIYNRLVPAIA